MGSDKPTMPYNVHDAYDIQWFIIEMSEGFTHFGDELFSLDNNIEDVNEEAAAKGYRRCRWSSSK